MGIFGVKGLGYINGTIDGSMRIGASYAKHWESNGKTMDHEMATATTWGIDLKVLFKRYKKDVIRGTISHDFDQEAYAYMIVYHNGDT